MSPWNVSPPSRALPLLAGLTLAVLAVHAWLLTGLPVGPGAGPRQGAAVLIVRQLVAPPQPERVASPAQRTRADRPRARPQRAATTPATDTPAAVPAEAPPPADQATQVAPAVLSEAVPALPEASAVLPEASAALPAEGSASAPQAAPAPPTETVVAALGDAPPVYATRPPPAARLRYELRRGLLTGEGELSWQPSADGYEFQVEGRAFGMPLLAWVSRGGFDAAGIAPQRFVDRRRGRDLRAANFQRDKGSITYSSVATEQALLAGAQDRLSWIAQLAAVADAADERLQPGRQVTMQVAGARGDADIWTFTVVELGPVEVVGQRVEGAIALRREPRKPFDTLVEVWLDPQRHHLPVRLRLATAGGGDALEFVLKP